MTPGPWRIRKFVNDRNGSVCFSIVAGWEVFNQHSTGDYWVDEKDVVAVSLDRDFSEWGDGIDDEENAYLISTAPDMLEILEIIENDTEIVPEWLWKRIQIVLEEARGWKDEHS